MKHSWEKMKLSKVLSQYREEIWVDDTKEYLQITNSKYDGIGLRGKKLGAEIGRKRQFVVNLDKYPNTITFTRQTIQVDEAIGLCPSEVNGCIVTENMPLFAVVNAEPKFIEYYFRTRLFLDQLHKTAALGTSQQSIHEDIFLNYEIPLPLLPEQQRIVSKIETVKQRIGQIKKLRAEQEKEIANFLYSYFKDVIDEFGLSDLGEGIEHRAEFILIDNETNYKLCRVQTKALGVVLREKKQGYDIKTKEQQICKTGEFLVAEMDARFGGYGIVPDELDGAIVSSHYFLYSFIEEKLNRKYLEYFSRTNWFFEQVVAKGSTNYAAIRPKQVLNYKIPLPSIEEQNRIVSVIEKLNSVKTNHSETEKELTQLMPALLDKAFKGEL